MTIDFYKTPFVPQINNVTFPSIIQDISYVPTPQAAIILDNQPTPAKLLPFSILSEQQVALKVQSLDNPLFKKKATGKTTREQVWNKTEAPTGKKRRIQPRQILRENESPSISRRGKKEIQEEDFIQHSHRRLQDFYVLALFFSKKAERTGKEPYEISLTRGKTDMQGRKGKGDTHASHTNIVPSVEDDLIQLQKEALKAEKKLTPIKKRTFKSLGVPEDFLELLEKEPDNQELIDKLDNLLKTESIQKKSGLKKLLNATDHLPREFNLYCDGRLEANGRAKAIFLLRECMMGKISPEEACCQFTKFAADFFDQSAQDVQFRITHLEKFSAFSKEAIQMEIDFNTKKIMTQEELQGYVTLVAQLVEEKKHMVVSIKGLKKANVRLHDAFYKEIFEACKAPSMSKSLLDRIQAIWMKRDAKAESEKLEEELEDRFKLLGNLKEWNEWQSKGAKEPKYEYLAGVYDKENQKVRPMTEGEKLDLAYDTMFKI